MKVQYQGKEVGIIKNSTKVSDMFEDLIKNSPKNIIACRCNNEIKSLDYEIKDGDSVELIDLTDKDGLRVYIRGALFIMSMAFNKLYPKYKLIVNYQLRNSMFCEFQNKNIEVTDEMIDKVTNKMKEIVKNNCLIKKIEMTKSQAKEFYKTNPKRGDLQLDNTKKDRISLYFCQDYYNYFYGVMPLSTGFINIFKLEKYKGGFILRYPSISDPTKLGEFKQTKKFLATLQEYDKIYDMMEISTIKDLNEKIEQGKSKELILESEALQEKKIAEIADRIASKKDKIKMILIAGPSSSGKTTFAKRLGIELKVNGMNPVTIGTDDYFVERNQNPKDENGEYDFETIDALDLNLFNDHLARLIKGEKVNIPTFDFKVGTKKYYDDKFLQMDKDDVLVIEGIHCLNDRLTEKIPNDEKFKIYISDLTVLNIDEFNRISTTDTRLVRRIVRDYNFRGYSALETLSRWDSVNKGEEKNIFPYQEKADVMFNSSLVYELAVLGKYARKLLAKIDSSHEEYAQSKRILSFLEYFKDIDETYIPYNSILREFIGGSVFDY